jgi:hypothetical protein
MTSEAFNPQSAIAELVAGQAQHLGRKLSFPQKCAAFYALNMGVKPAYVTKAFGVTPGTTSNLKRAGRAPSPDHGNYQGGFRPRYPEIAREFERLGAEAFRNRYYTDDVHTQLMRIKYEAEETGDNRTPQGPNRNADRFSWDKIGAFQCGNSWWRVDWTYGPGGPGWRSTDCLPNGQQPEGQETMYQGLEANDGSGQAPPKPFARSKFAYDGVFKRIHG